MTKLQEQLLIEFWRERLRLVRELEDREHPRVGGAKRRKVLFQGFPAGKSSSGDSMEGFRALPDFFDHFFHKFLGEGAAQITLQGVDVLFPAKARLIAILIVKEKGGEAPGGLPGAP